MSEPFVIEATDLRKQYDGVEALRGLTLQVPVGSIFAKVTPLMARPPPSTGVASPQP